MAAHVVVTDFSLQQRKIAVNPSKHMSEVRNEACMKMRDDASNYGLKHNGKPVDLSRTFRQSGLTSGAKLELVAVSKSPSVVSVALQHPDGSRQTDKVPSNTTLWLLLRKFESDKTKNVNITARSVAQTDSGSSGSGNIYYEAPVLRIMNREFAELEDLQKTLAQIGVNAGSVLINLRYINTMKPLQDAKQHISQYLNEVSADMDADSTPSIQESTVEATTTGDRAASAGQIQAEKPLPPRQREQSPPKPSTSEPPIASSSGRKVEVFAAPTGTVPVAAQSGFDDEAYIPSKEDAIRHLQRLGQRSQNQRLLSDAELAAIEEEKRAKKEAVRETTIKIKFPDETSVTFNVTLEDTGASLYAFVRDMIVEKSEPFWLVYRGPKRPNERLQDSPSVRLIKDVGFDGPTLVNFNWQEGASEQAKRKPALAEQYRSQAKPLTVPEPPRIDSTVKEAAPTPEAGAKIDNAGDKQSKEERLKKFIFGKKK